MRSIRGYRSLIILLLLAICGPVALSARADYVPRGVEGVWLTVAGVGPGGGAKDGDAIDARFRQPYGVAIGPSDAIYIADTFNHTIRKDAGGVVTTLAGAAGSFAYLDGPGAIARFNQPIGITVDGAGNVFVTELGNNAIRKITPAGVVSTIAGAAAIAGNSDGTGPAARFNAPAGIAVTGDGTLYVADTGNHRIRKITPAGVVTTLAGSTAGHADGAGAAAQFSFPYSIAVGAHNTLVVGDNNNNGFASIRTLTLAGSVSTLVNGGGAALPFSGLSGMTVDSVGNVYVSDAANHRIVSIAPDGAASLFAGTGTAGSRDGAVAVATFNQPRGLAFDSCDRLLVADAGNHAIRAIESGVVSSVAGLASAGWRDGTGTSTQFISPTAIVSSPGGMFVGDGTSIRHIGGLGADTTFAGDPYEAGHVDDTGAAARFSPIAAMALAADGTLFVASGPTIRAVTSAGVVTTIAGDASTPECTDGIGAAARFKTASGIAIGAAGLLWVTDAACNTVRTIATDGTVTTVAGTAGQSGTTDDVGTAARFGNPVGIAVASTGVVFVSDQKFNTIRKIATDFTVSTFAGTANEDGLVDGVGAAARFTSPAGLGIFLDDDTLLLADAGNNAVRVILADATVITLGGNGQSGWTDGLGHLARFNAPQGIAITDFGAVVLADTGNHVVRVGYPSIEIAPEFTFLSPPQRVIAGGNVPIIAVATGTPEPTYQWQGSTDGENFHNLSDIAPYSGTTTTGLTINNVPANLAERYFRSVATNDAGEAISPPIALSILDVAVFPDPKFVFGATKASAGGALLAVTAPQNARVVFPGATPAQDWVAVADQPWVQITNGAGTGTGQFAVSIVNPGNVIGGTANLTATVTVNFASLDPLQFQVDLNVLFSPTGAVPFGQIDAPTNGSTGLVGAIGVSGWALDDVGVAAVKVYRNCLPAEPQSGCISGAPYGLGAGSLIVYLGDAAFLEDARSDVENAFKTLPASNRAGWGLLVLTNMLPRSTGTFAGQGGQGPVTFYAVAFDQEGQGRALGYPAWTDGAGHTTVTLDNDHIAKPFGAIDTPGQGELITTPTLANFGWALTPDPGNGTLIPTDGSTMFVFVDGVPIGNVTYNQCRGNVGNPPGPGVFCNDDVASIFGNATPQPPLTPRVSNPTIFRNLDAQRGAIGSFLIDLSGYTEGLHTIAWSVTDSANRIEGIGSRFFRVLPNADKPAAAAAPASSASLQRGSAKSRAAAAASAAADTSSSPIAAGAAQLAEGMAGRSNGRVLVRTGFDLRESYKAVPQLAGSYAVEIPQMGRVEAQLGRGAELSTSKLPVGAQLDSATGVFTWTPPPGYLGAYAFSFNTSGGSFTLTVTIK